MDSSNKYVIDEPSPKGRKKGFRVLLAVFCLLVASLLGIVGYYLILFSHMSDDSEVRSSGTTADVSGGIDDDDHGAVVSQIDKADNEIDIMMIGVDNRSDKFSGLSDVMMYMRVNTDKKTIKLVSFMRDTLVNIDGHGKNKLNTAYSFGKIDLMYDTYKDIFGLKPDYYIVVNFYGMEDIINAMDGVDIELEKNELEWLNININEINNEASGKDAANIKKSGMQHLTGRQAVAYMRIRHPGGDAARIERQQKVMYKLFEKAQNIGVGQIPSLIETMSQYVRTDLSLSTMIDLAKSVKGVSTDSITTFRYPEEFKDSYYEGAGSTVVPKDADAEYQKLNNFLNE